MPVPDYDNTLIGKYIKAIENPDNRGLVGNKWFRSPRKVDDSRNRGYGVDIVNNDVAAKVTKGRTGNWLTVSEEKDIRNGYIHKLQGTIDRHFYPYVRRQPLTDEKRAMATGLLYRGDGINSYRELADPYYNGTDEEFSSAVESFYKNKKGGHYQPERAKNHSKFMSTQPLSSSASSLITTDWNNTEFKPQMTFDTGGQIISKPEWDELSMAEKADIMKLAIEGGVYDLDSIRSGYNEYARGGKIHIKPENRGKFTALKKRTGHSATWFKEHGTPAQKKMAVFALNARKWKH